MAIYELKGRRPDIAASAYVADSAQVIGNVVLDDNASVWFGAVIRGDSDPIRVGKNSNVQDTAVLHADPGFPLTLGKNVSVGHMAMLHGCTVGDGSLIGIGSVILNGTVIGKNCLIGAKTLIPEGKNIPDGSMVLGSPGKVVRQLRPEEIAHIHGISEHYVERFKRYRDVMKQEP